MWKGSRLCMKLCYKSVHPVIWFDILVLELEVCFLVSTHASEQYNLSATEVIPLKFYSVVFDLSLCWHLSFPVCVQILSHLLPLLLSSQAHYSVKEPFTDISSLLYNFYSPSLSLADANLSYLSTGTREIAGFSLSFQTHTSDLPGQTKLGKEVIAKTVTGNCIQLWKQQATAVVLEQQKA